MQPEVISYRSERDGAIVVEIDARDFESGQRLRVYINDGCVFSARPEHGDHKLTDVAEYAAELAKAGESMNALRYTYENGALSLNGEMVASLDGCAWQCNTNSTEQAVIGEALARAANAHFDLVAALSEIISINEAEKFCKFAGAHHTRFVARAALVNAAKEFGACVTHATACNGLLDNREKGEE